MYEFIISRVLVSTYPWAGPSGLHLKTFFFNYTGVSEMFTELNPGHHAWKEIGSRGGTHILIIRCKHLKERQKRRGFLTPRCYFSLCLNEAPHMLPEWHIDTVTANPSNYISHKTEWDWMGSLERCIKQNHGGRASVVFSDQGTLGKVEWHSSSIALFPVCVCFRYKLSDRLPGTKSHRAEKVPLLVCMSCTWGSERQELAVGVLHSVLRSRSSAQWVSTGILQLTFLVALWLVFFVHQFENVEKNS